MLLSLRYPWHAIFLSDIYYSQCFTSGIHVTQYLCLASMIHIFLCVVSMMYNINMYCPCYTMFVPDIHDIQYVCLFYVSDFKYCASHIAKFLLVKLVKEKNIGLILSVTAINHWHRPSYTVSSSALCMLMCKVKGRKDMWKRVKHSVQYFTITYYQSKRNEIF